MLGISQLEALPITTVGMSVLLEVAASEYQGELQAVAEIAYGSEIKIYRDGAWLSGCSAYSYISTRRGTQVVFVASVSADRESVASTAVTDITTESFSAAMASVAAARGSSATVNVPAVGEIVSTVIYTPAPTSAPTVAGGVPTTSSTTTSSDTDEGIVIAVAVGAAVVVLVGAVACYFCCRGARMPEEQQCSHPPNGQCEYCEQNVGLNPSTDVEMKADAEMKTADGRACSGTESDTFRACM